ncbi:hypothetical protein E2C01_057535 [Portunus trituberculatus]|uniref:Uncharacterized protein n=1 Tax=Portunus trituberculatus TaxID=210409 RepID=A0A5B7H262_PORTR|nr:hypothetical protein [Portunus trituberculatus]
MRKGEVPLETCERGGNEAGGAERPIEATFEGGPQADSEAEETSLSDAIMGQLESCKHKQTLYFEPAPDKSERKGGSQVT